ncbi:MAG: tetratricopeptide repeat protein [Anaerolineae bacterium]|nr:tetratricopeptide repeat protein [Anaerolineae bacterium]
MKVVTKQQIRSFAVIHYKSGLTHGHNKDYQAAIAAYQQAIARDANFAVTHGSLAGCYRQMGQEENAQKHIEIARGLMANESAYNRACFAAICGDVAEAVDLLAQAVAQAPGDRDLAQKDPDFAAIRDDPRFQAVVGGV